MGRYRVYLPTTASCVVEVDADDEDDAVDLAIDEAPAHLCAQCESSRYGSIGVELSGEWDADKAEVEAIA
jgi:hypothetical protein